jgi:hypothetical protein
MLHSFLHALIHPSAWNRNSRKFISKILHTHTPMPLVSPLQAPRSAPCRYPLVTLMDRYARSWMFFFTNEWLHFGENTLRPVPNAPGSGTGLC